MLLYLVRHGQTVDNVAGRMQGQLHGKLTELGINQAKKLSFYLKDEKFNAVYCSDRGRAVETVLPFIEQDSKFPILFTPELQEKNIGSYAGMTAKECDEHDEKFGLFTDLESEEEFYERGGKFLDSIVQKHQNDSKILLIAHAAINARIIGNILGLTVEESRKRKGQPNAALSIFEFRDKVWKIIIENEVGFLGDSAGSGPVGKLV